MSATATESKGQQRLARLRANTAMHRVLRTRFGLKADDEALARVAEFYETPAWAVGCIGVVDAMFLYDMVAGVRPERIIEIGVASGGSTSLLLRALADAGLTARDERGEARLRSFDLHPFCYFDRTRPVGSAVAEMCPDLADGLDLRRGMTAIDAGRLLAGGGAALAFVDGDHRHPAPTADVLALAPALAPGAWIVLHDIDLPAAAKRYEANHATRVDWHHAGAEVLFEHWPFEKLRGAGDAANIGAVRVPTGRAMTRGDLAGPIGEPWEFDPPAGVRGVLG